MIASLDTRYFVGQPVVLKNLGSLKLAELKIEDLRPILNTYQPLKGPKFNNLQTAQAYAAKRESENFVVTKPATGGFLGEPARGYYSAVRLPIFVVSMHNLQPCKVEFVVINGVSERYQPLPGEVDPSGYDSCQQRCVSACKTSCC